MACTWLTHTDLLLGHSSSRGSGGSLAGRPIIDSHLVFAYISFEKNKKKKHIPNSKEADFTKLEAPRLSEEGGCKCKSLRSVGTYPRGSLHESCGWAPAHQSEPGQGKPRNMSSSAQGMQNSHMLSPSPFPHRLEAGDSGGCGEGRALRVSLRVCKNTLSHVKSETSGEREVGRKMGGGREALPAENKPRAPQQRQAARGRQAGGQEPPSKS